jgi:hypothetical protein
MDNPAEPEAHIAPPPINYDEWARQALLLYDAERKCWAILEGLIVNGQKQWKVERRAKPNPPEAQRKPISAGAR